jgi:hypothetical protein
MGTSMTVIVRDPVDPYDLFAAAKKAVGDPPRWHEMEFGDVRMIQAASGQGAEASVSVHYPASGGVWSEEGDPEGHAAILFTTSGDARRERLERIAAALGVWLGRCGLDWLWQIQEGDGSWRAGV